MISHLLNVVYSSVGFKKAPPEVALELILLAEKCKPYASTLDLIEPANGQTIRVDQLNPELLQKLIDLNLLSFNIWDKTTNRDVIFNAYGKAVKSLLAADVVYKQNLQPAQEESKPELNGTMIVPQSISTPELYKSLYETPGFTLRKLQAIQFLSMADGCYLPGPLISSELMISILDTLSVYSALGLVTTTPYGSNLKVLITVKGKELLQILLKEMEQTK